MGLLISAWSTNPDRANNLVPYALIPQVMFSGVLVPLGANDLVTGLSHLMIAKWAFRALGSALSVDDIPNGPPRGDFAWNPTTYLLILALFVAFFAVFITFVQRRKDKLQY